MTDPKADKNSPTSFRIPQPLLKRLRIRCAQMEIQQSDAVTEAIENWLKGKIVKVVHAKGEADLSPLSDEDLYALVEIHKKLKAAAESKATQTFSVQTEDYLDFIQNADPEMIKAVQNYIASYKQIANTKSQRR